MTAIQMTAPPTTMTQKRFATMALSSPAGSSADCTPLQPQSIPGASTANADKLARKRLLNGPDEWPGAISASPFPLAPCTAKPDADGHPVCKLQSDRIVPADPRIVGGKRRPDGMRAGTSSPLRSFAAMMKWLKSLAVELFPAWHRSRLRRRKAARTETQSDDALARLRRRIELQDKTDAK